MQVVVLAIKGDDAVPAKVRYIGDQLVAAGGRVRRHDRTDTPLGRRAVDRELKGVPVRVEADPVTGSPASDGSPPASEVATIEEAIGAVVPGDRARIRGPVLAKTARPSSPRTR